jgi:hypothetical protein
MSNNPPENALTGTVADYVNSLDVPYQAPICIIGLRLLTAQRAAYCQDGAALQALAKMEIELLQIHSNVKSLSPVREVYGPPPS